MDNYEINILRRDGNWKKVNPNDRIMDGLEENEALEKKSINSIDEKSKNDFLYYLNEVNSIIGKLEILEKEKNKLKDQLKNYEQEFLNKKINTEDKINSLIKEKEMLDKTINLIKNLKKF
ncbi:hypothetical protein OBA40_06075 [Alphaproteobacteria bacterium]|nr:hypothetical protein [Alphaproteobacteria bacterium]